MQEERTMECVATGQSVHELKIYPCDGMTAFGYILIKGIFHPVRSTADSKAPSAPGADGSESSCFAHQLI